MSVEIITIGNKNITVYSTPAIGNAQLREVRKAAAQRREGRNERRGWRN